MSGERRKVDNIVRKKTGPVVRDNDASHRWKNGMKSKVLSKTEEKLQ